MKAPSSISQSTSQKVLPGESGAPVSGIRSRLPASPSPLMVGYLVIKIVVIIWAGFALTLRAVGKSPLSPADVALIRFAIPALCLLPFLRSRMAQLRAVRLRDLAMILLGGIPFFFVATEGARTTSAAHVSALIAGTAPLSVALVSILLERASVPKRRWFALGLIALGAVGMILASGKSGAEVSLVGIGNLLFASLLWGAYTIGLRRTGLDATGNAIILTSLSLFFLLILILLGVTPSHVGSFTFAEALPFILVQGFGVGLIATIGYAFATARLGSSRSAVFGSLAPPLSALLAIPIFNEAINLPTAVSIAVLTYAVFLANRSLR